MAPGPSGLTRSGETVQAGPQRVRRGNLCGAADKGNRALLLGQRLRQPRGLLDLGAELVLLL
jgi:hypothetical protein